MLRLRVPDGGVELMWQNEAFAFTETSAFAVTQSFVHCSFDPACDKRAYSQLTDINYTDVGIRSFDARRSIAFQSWCDLNRDHVIDIYRVRVGANVSTKKCCSESLHIQ